MVECTQAKVQRAVLLQHARPETPLGERASERWTDSARVRPPLWRHSGNLIFGEIEDGFTHTTLLEALESRPPAVTQKIPRPSRFGSEIVAPRARSSTTRLLCFRAPHEVLFLFFNRALARKNRRRPACIRPSPTAFFFLLLFSSCPQTCVFHFCFTFCPNFRSND